MIPAGALPRFVDTPVKGRPNRPPGTKKIRTAHRFPAEMRPFPLKIAGFSAVSRRVPPYPAFLKYVVPLHYVTEGDGPVYFYYGNTRIKVAEHFNDRGKPIGILIEDVIRCSVARQKEKAKEN